MKKIMVFITLMILTIGTYNTVFAADFTEMPMTMNCEQENTHAEFEMYEIKMEIDMEDNLSGNEIEPYKTITGSSGVSTIDYMESASMITWSVKPNTVLNYSFAGAMKIIDESTAKVVGWEDLLIAGSGRLGGEVDLYDFDLTRGHSYRAVLTGTAVDTAGNNYYVSSGAYLPFTY